MWYNILILLFFYCVQHRTCKARSDTAGRSPSKPSYSVGNFVKYHRKAAALVDKE